MTLPFTTPIERATTLQQLKDRAASGMAGCVQARRELQHRTTEDLRACLKRPPGGA